MATRWMCMTAALLLGLLSMACVGQVREVTRDLGPADAARPMRVTLWYSEGPCLADTLKLCLAPSAVTHKVIVVSHGSMGASKDYSWIGRGLAGQGFIVVGLNHFGESRAYGAQTQNIRATGMAWERALDASRVLDALATLQPFDTPVAWDDAIVVGHSAGGQTAALLAGARFDLQALATYCRSGQASEDLSCGYARDVERAPSAFVSAFNGNYRDPRVRKIVLLDPALGPALVPASLQGSRIPTLVIGALHADFLPWNHHGARYTDAIPHARTLLLEGREGHFVFLSVCQNDVTVNGVPLCTDKPGVDRGAVHEQLLSSLVAFITADDEIPLSGPRALTDSSSPVAMTPTVLEILAYTPRWVFGVFFVLCVLGVMQTRTRRVRGGLALVLPVAMLGLSIAGVFQYTDHWLSGLVSWLVGAVIVSALVASVKDVDGVTFDDSTGRLRVKGSWTPLLVILGIFITRYALGVASALHAEALAHWPQQMLVAGGLGAWSGYFAYRTWRCWRVLRAMTRQTHPAQRRP